MRQSEKSPWIAPAAGWRHSWAQPPPPAARLLSAWAHEAAWGQYLAPGPVPACLLTHQMVLVCVQVCGVQGS
jgi:hypothetical protein